MKIQRFDIQDLALFHLKVHEDNRGFFVERFNAHIQKEIGSTFLQDNFSRSAPNVLRGLHFQKNPGQGKLVTCLNGSILDVVVDLRAKSPTFCKFLTIELSGDNPSALWIPSGFAHGFIVTSKTPADVLYKVDSPYSPSGEVCISWNDATLAVPWPTETPIMSEKDKNGISIESYKRNPAF